MRNIIIALFLGMFLCLIVVSTVMAEVWADEGYIGNQWPTIAKTFNPKGAPPICDTAYRSIGCHILYKWTAQAGANTIEFLSNLNK